MYKDKGHETNKKQSIDKFIKTEIMDITNEDTVYTIRKSEGDIIDQGSFRQNNKLQIFDDQKIPIPTKKDIISLGARKYSPF